MSARQFRTAARVTAAGLIAAAGCRHASSPSKPSNVQHATKPADDTGQAYLTRIVAAWDKLTEGRTVARAESRFILIENDSCPGTRIVTSRFQPTDAGLVQLTEDNSQVRCTEGVRSRPFAVIWHDSTYTAAPDTIHPFGEALAIAGGELVYGLEQDGMSPSEYDYYSIITAKPLFRSRISVQTFRANDVQHYLAVDGNLAADTAASVYYATARGVKQRLTIRRDPGFKSSDDIAVDSVALVAPTNGCCNRLASATSAKDTFAVSGFTLKFQLMNADLDGSEGDIRRAYIVRLVNDSLVLDPAPTAKSAAGKRR